MIDYKVGHISIYKEPQPYHFEEYNGNIIVRQSDGEFIENRNYNADNWQEYSFGVILSKDRELKIYKENDFTVIDFT